LKIVSIADHNSIKGFSSAKQALHDQDHDLILIPGIELDCHYKGTNLHILGYGVNPNEPWFSTYSQRIDDEDLRLSSVRANKIRDLGLFLEDAQLAKLSIHGILTGEMIGEVALEDARNLNNPFVNFYWDFMAQGKPAYVEVEFISAKEAIQHIKDAGGLSVFAHPGNNVGMNEALLEEILALGIDGIEVYSSYHNEEKTQFYREKALAHHLLMTLGSDFHGKSKPAIKLGQFKCPDELKLTEAFLSRPEILPYL
jgi:predicted metal-dependent phosphoesterase TrpH